MTGPEKRHVGSENSTSGMRVPWRGRPRPQEAEGGFQTFSREYFEDHMGFASTQLCQVA